jgi:hypothetical protein
LLFLLGAQFRTVETFVLSAEATRVLGEWWGDAAPTPTSALGGLAVRAGAPVRKQWRPPAWLGYALLSAGGVLMVHGAVQRSR